MPAISGHHARVAINATNWRASRWSVDWKVDDFDTTTFENFNVGVYTPGIYDYTISLDAFWDTIQNPFSAPLSMGPGQSVSITIQYDKASWTFPNVLIVDCRNETSVRDVVRLSLTGKASGYSAVLAGVIPPGNV